jgi:hypothetical protein
LSNPERNFEFWTTLLREIVAMMVTRVGRQVVKGKRGVEIIVLGV